MKPLQPVERYLTLVLDKLFPSDQILFDHWCKFWNTIFLKGVDNIARAYNTKHPMLARSRVAQQYTMKDGQVRVFEAFAYYSAHEADQVWKTFCDVGR